MSVQLKELIDKIKNEGVKEAEAKASEIIQNAEANAKKIIEDAKSEAVSILEKAENDTAQMKNTSKQAIQQAARDAVLSLKSEISALFGRILSSEVKNAMDIALVKESILLIVKALGENELKQIIVPEKNLEEIKKYCLDKLSAEAKKGLEIKPSNDMDAGFRIAEKDGSAYYDLTDKGITDFLTGYLNPKVSEYLKGE